MFGLFSCILLYPVSLSASAVSLKLLPLTIWVPRELGAPGYSRVITQCAPAGPALNPAEWSVLLGEGSWFAWSPKLLDK